MKPSLYLDIKHNVSWSVTVVLFPKTNNQKPAPFPQNYYYILQSKPEEIMRNRSFARNIAIIIIFSAVAFLLFTENVRTIQVIGLLACGAVIGASISNILMHNRIKQKAG
jgi:hypothetical protein